MFCRRTRRHNTHFLVIISYCLCFVQNSFSALNKCTTTSIKVVNKVWHKKGWSELIFGVEGIGSVTLIFTCCLQMSHCLVPGTNVFNIRKCTFKMYGWVSWWRCIFFYWTFNSWKLTGACSALYPCPGTKSLGYQYPLCQMNIHCTGPVSRRNIVYIRNNTSQWN